MVEKETFLRGITSNINYYNNLYDRIEERFVGIKKRVKLIEEFMNKKKAIINRTPKFLKKDKEILRDYNYFAEYLIKFAKKKTHLKGLITWYNVNLENLTNLYKINKDAKNYLITPEDHEDIKNSLEKIKKQFLSWEKKYDKLLKKYNKRYKGKKVHN